MQFDPLRARVAAGQRVAEDFERVDIAVGDEVALPIPRGTFTPRAGLLLFQPISVSSELGPTRCRRVTGDQCRHALEQQRDRQEIYDQVVQRQAPDEFGAADPYQVRIIERQIAGKFHCHLRIDDGSKVRCRFGRVQ